jgi:hypothetical protein
MLGNLQAPPEPFEDIIRTHFRLKSTEIHKQLDEWLAQDDGQATSADGGGYSNARSADNTGSSSNGFRKDIEELKNSISKLK